MLKKHRVLDQEGLPAYCGKVLASMERCGFWVIHAESSLLDFYFSMGPYGALHAPKTHLVLAWVVYLAKHPISGNCKVSF